MQKVVSSSLIIRSTEKPRIKLILGFFVAWIRVEMGRC